MIDPIWYAVGTGLFGAVGAMIWSFLMASKVAAPRAAAKSKLLLVNILTGATEEDKVILEKVRRSLVRPEVEALSKIIMPDVSKLEKRLDDALAAQEETYLKLSKLIEDSIPEIPEFDLDPLFERLDKLESGLPDMIGTHISMALKGVQATEAKQIKALLDEMGLEGIAAEKREQIISRMSLRQKAGVRLMTLKIPKSARESNPLAVAVFDEARGIVGEYLVAEDEAGVVGQNPARRSSSGFNPGYNP